MDEVFFTALEHYYGVTIAGAIVIALMLVLLTFRVGRIAERFDRHEKHFEKFSDAADKFTAVSVKTDHLERQMVKLGSMAATVVDLKARVDMIHSFVNPNSPTRAQSPINLTPIGNDIVKALGAKEVLEKYCDSTKRDVEDTKPTNAYDIQMAAMQVAKGKLLSYLNEDEVAAVKKQAFERGLTVEDVMSVYGVLIRDRILSDHNIPISAVDEHTPKS